MATRLYDLRINEISGVTRGANRRKFLIVKREGESDDRVDNVNLAVPLATDAQIEKFARDNYGSIEKALKENVLTVGARNIP